MELNKRTLRKVPEITLIFWVIKILTTAMGEATSDFFDLKYNPYVVVPLGGLILLICLFIQISRPKYNVWSYWITVVMVAVFGTMAADSLHIQLKVPYIISSIFFAIILAAVFISWQKIEHNLSIHSIYTTRREILYWLCVLFTFALGTAVGDLTATTFKLGYLTSGIIFSVLFLIPAVVYLFNKKHTVLLFWIAYILTRPLGASFADYTSKSRSIGGLNYGDSHVAIVLTIAIFLLVLLLSIRQKHQNVLIKSS